jgi:hypothetical protein
MEQLLALIAKAAKTLRLSNYEKRRLRAHLIHHIREQHHLTTKELVQSPYMPLRSTWMKFASHVVVILLIISVATTSSVLAAADSSLPGDKLYGVKVNVTEEIRSFITTNPVQKIEYDITRVENRLDDAALLALKGELDTEAQETITTLLADHTLAITDATNKLETDVDTPNSRRALHSKLETSMKSHSVILEAISVEKPEAKLEPIVALAQETAQEANSAQEDFVTTQASVSPEDSQIEATEAFAMLDVHFSELTQLVDSLGYFASTEEIQTASLVVEIPEASNPADTSEETPLIENTETSEPTSDLDPETTPLESEDTSAEESDIDSTATPEEHSDADLVLDINSTESPESALNLDEAEDPTLLTTSSDEEIGEESSLEEDTLSEIEVSDDSSEDLTTEEPLGTSDTETPTDEALDTGAETQISAEETTSVETETVTLEEKLHITLFKLYAVLVDTHSQIQSIMQTDALGDALALIYNTEEEIESALALAALIRDLPEFLEQIEKEAKKKSPETEIETPEEQEIISTPYEIPVEESPEEELLVDDTETPSEELLNEDISLVNTDTEPEETDPEQANKETPSEEILEETSSLEKHKDTEDENMSIDREHKETTTPAEETSLETDTSAIQSVNDILE